MAEKSLAELDFDLMFNLEKHQYLYVAPSKFPAVNFEISIMVPETTFFQEISDIIKSSSDLISIERI